LFVLIYNILNYKLVKILILIFKYKIKFYKDFIKLNITIIRINYYLIDLFITCYNNTFIKQLNYQLKEAYKLFSIFKKIIKKKGH
jgi:hypothetical protein